KTSFPNLGWPVHSGSESDAKTITNFSVDGQVGSTVIEGNQISVTVNAPQMVYPQFIFNFSTTGNSKVSINGVQFESGSAFTLPEPSNISPQIIPITVTPTHGDGKKDMNIYTLVLNFPGIVTQGVNYDPSGSFLFQKGVGTNNISMMQEAIEKDLDLIPQINKAAGQNMNITHIKTFFTNYNSADSSNPDNSLNIADVINDWNSKNSNTPLQVALGIYEFRPRTDACPDNDTCDRWTQAEIQSAITAANKYGYNLIDRIIVGNEDIDQEFFDAALIRARVLKDIKTIKGKLNDKQIKVGTAQMWGTVTAMLPSSNPPADLAAIFNAADFIGSNPYPFWAQVDYSNAKKTFENYWSQIKSATNKEIIVTEEGWPSGGKAQGAAVPSLDHEHDYIFYFRNRPSSVVPVSYIFALKDLLQNSTDEPNSNWGIYSQDGSSSVINADGTVGNKTLAPGHIIVNVKNEVNNPDTGQLRVTQLSVCINDYQYLKPNTCYSIYGYPGSGQLDNNISSKQFLIDVTGNTYKSLIATYQGDDPTQPQLQLCYIENSVLTSLTNGSTIHLQWTKPSGDIACGVEIK
ncbi:MAG TPA: hypothetical protein VKR58_08555, partial [Aquella sp.]|nr:hypothetical protein [Aquella sp.]